MVISNRSDKSCLFSNDPKPVVFGGILGMHPKSSFEDDLQLHPLASLFDAWGKGLLDRPCSNL